MVGTSRRAKASACALSSAGRMPSPRVSQWKGFLANWQIPRLANFEATHPEIRLHLHTCGELDALEKQRVDALIVSGRDWPRTIAATVLFEDRVGPVCIPSLAAGLRRPLDVAGLPLLHTKSHPQAWPSWGELQGLDDPGFAKGRQFDHLPLMLEAAAAGLGIAVAPSILVAREIESQRLLAPFGFVACGASFACCVLKARAEQPELRSLCEWLSRQCGTSD
ncbi:hypothetical protein EVC45_36420 [Paraburkholderia sp. UYCP14C]|nr:hypothetical protein EVC45_36420 [Paraburkholderia sp. UYCP14C]